MKHRGLWTVVRRIALTALVLLAAPLALASCGGTDVAPSSSASTVASSSVGPLTGEWMPVKGSLTFDVSGDSSGYTWDPHAAKPAGGVIVVENGATYYVTLVSADGKRFAAGAARPQGHLLLVRLRRRKPSTEFFLAARGKDAAQMIAAVEGSPQPKAWAIDLAPGQLLEGGQ